MSKILPSRYDLTEHARDLKERMRVNRHEVHGGCCGDTADDAVPCTSPVCAIEYEAEVLLGQLADYLEEGC